MGKENGKKLTIAEYREAVEKINRTARESPEEIRTNFTQLFMDSGLVEYSHSDIFENENKIKRSRWTILSADLSKEAPKIFTLVIDPVRFWKQIDRLLKKESADFFLDLLKATQKVRGLTKYENDIGEPGLSPSSFHITREDSRIMNAIRKFLAKVNGEIKSLDGTDRVLLAEYLKVDIHKVDNYLKQYSIVNNVASLDDLQAESGFESSDDTDNYEALINTTDCDLDFKKCLSRAKKAFLACGKAPRATLRLLVTLNLSAFSADSNKEFYADNYKELQELFKSRTENPVDRGAIENKEQMENGFDKINLHYKKTEDCCDFQEIFDTFIANWIFAEGKLPFKGKDERRTNGESSRINAKAYSEMLKEAFEFSKRSDKAPSSVTLGKILEKYVAAVMRAMFEDNAELKKYFV